jgi:hypothetical protein
MIQSSLDDREFLVSAVESFEFSGTPAGSENELGLGPGVNPVLQSDDKLIVQPTMEKSRPSARAIPRKFELGSNAPEKFSKNNVHGDRIGIQAVDPGAESKVVGQASETTIPSTPQVISGKPPDEVENVWPTKSWDAMPGNLRWVQVFDALAVDVNVKLAGDLRYPLDHDPLRPVALVQERRNNCEAHFVLCSVHSETYSHYFTARHASAIGPSTPALFCLSTH